MEQLIAGDIRYILQHHLECKDIWNLCKVSEYEKTQRKLMNLLHNKCIDEIKKRLTEMFFNDPKIAQEFLSILNETGAVISGSFLVQCLLNENWKSDVDIFVPIIGNEITYTSNHNIKTKVDDFLFRVYHFYNYYAADRYSHHVSNKIRWIRDFADIDVKKDKKTNEAKHIFQVILVNVEKDEICEFIRNSFDFDLVKNTFIKHKLSVLNFEEIFSKNVRFKTGDRLGLSIKRRVKYEKRGFTFYYDSPAFNPKDETNINHIKEFLAAYRQQDFVPCGPRLTPIQVRELSNEDKVKEDCSCHWDGKCEVALTFPNNDHFHIQGKYSGNDIIVLVP